MVARYESKVAGVHVQVHVNALMSPLELEMYHQIKNDIGVNPSFYKYISMSDANTTVRLLSLIRLAFT